VPLPRKKLGSVFLRQAEFASKILDYFPNPDLSIGGGLEDWEHQ
jgi:hypothetical protein